MLITKIIRKDQGFTIVELLVAMTAFTSMILIVSIATMQLGRMYSKGVSSIKTQEVTRATLANVTEQVSFTSGLVSQSLPQTVAAGVGSYTRTAYCIGNVRYTYALDRRLSNSVSGGHSNATKQLRRVLWQDNNYAVGCNPVDLHSTVTIPGKELLADNIRLKKFDIVDVLGQDLTNITIETIFGESDLIEYSGADPVKCRGQFVGSQFCSVSNLKTEVYRRYPSSI